LTFLQDVVDYHFLHTTSKTDLESWGNENTVIPEITCVEFNPQYVEVGKKLLPEANWIASRSKLIRAGNFAHAVPAHRH